MRTGEGDIISGVALEKLLALTGPVSSFCSRCGATDFYPPIVQIVEDKDMYSCVEIICPTCASMDFNMSRMRQ